MTISTENTQRQDKSFFSPNLRAIASAGLIALTGLTSACSKQANMSQRENFPEEFTAKERVFSL
jgi:hypothetical protein